MKRGIVRTTVLALGLFTSGWSLATAEELTVVMATPQGDLEDQDREAMDREEWEPWQRFHRPLPSVDRIQILFSSPVVPLSAPDPGETRPAWLRVVPEIRVRWRWAGPSELIGDILEKVPRASEFTITVKKGLKALDKSALKADFQFSFQTPRPRLAVMATERPQWYDSTLEWMGSGQVFTPSEEPVPVTRDQTLLILTDIPVDMGTLREALKIEAAPHPIPEAAGILSSEAIQRLKQEDPEGYAGWSQFLEAAQGPPPHSIDVQIEPDPELPGQIFRLRAQTDDGRWPQGTILTVQVSPKVRALQGPIPNLPYRQGFLTSWPLAPLRIDPRVNSQMHIEAARASLELTSRVRPGEIWPRLRWRQAGETEWRTHSLPKEQAAEPEYPTESIDLGKLELQPGKDYELCLDRGATSEDGSVLGFPWCRRFTTAHTLPQMHVVEGQGVLEWSGPHLVPFSSVNVLTVLSRSLLVDEERLFELLAPARNSDGEYFDPRPGMVQKGSATVIKPPGRPNQWDFSPLNLDPILGGKPGVVLSSLAIGEVLPNSDRPDEPVFREPWFLLTQVTSLGMTLKKTRHEGYMIWVTRLADARPVSGATVRVRGTNGSVLWEGTTDPQGLVTTSDDLPGELVSFITARLGEDLTFARTEWYEGVRAWEFNLPADWHEERPVTGLIWVDRGIARPGETVHAKVILRERHNRRLKQTSQRSVVLGFYDGEGRLAVKKSAKLDLWGAAETTFEIPPSASLGTWSVNAASGFDAAHGRLSADRDWEVAPATFRVAEFRRPKFRVEATADRDQLAAGDALGVTVEGIFLAGGFMAGAPVKWNSTAVQTVWRPQGQAWKDFEFLPFGFDEDEEERGFFSLGEGEGLLDGTGRMTFKTKPITSPRGWPLRVTAEAEVRDVDRQTSAARSSTLVLPGEFLVGLKEPGFFCETGRGVDTEVAAVLPEGKMKTGISVQVELGRRRWDSVRRRTASGRYEFESHAVDEVLATREVTTEDKPVPLHFEVKEGGYYQLVARSTDSRGNQLTSSMSFYVLGPGYTPWRMDRANRIDILPEKETYLPGETARVLVQSPWESALALITVERSGVLEREVRTLTGTMPVLEIPIRPEYTPNVFVSVVLLRGRVDLPPEKETIDPGKPAFRVGICELTVPPRQREMKVEVGAEKPEYRPGQTATALLKLTGADAKPRRASVTLWAVDAGVLDLTGFRTPDPLSAFYERQGLGVSTAESRSRLIGRRSFGVKGGKAGGGGGLLAGDQYLRRDFRALAVWQGDIVTSEDGTATLTFPLPDSLTTYRLMAVAMAGDEEFGSGEAEFRVTKPMGLEPALPRFLRPGDRAGAGLVLRNRTANSLEVTLEARSAAPDILRLEEGESQRLTLAPNESKIVRFPVQAGEPGTATMTFTARAAAPSTETDALELNLPVISANVQETSAAFFAVDKPVEQAVQVPKDILATRGGLTVHLSPTALLEGQNGSRFLADYPHACAEQIASRALGLAAADRIGKGFAPERVDGIPLKEWLARQASRLRQFQKADGGFGFWAGSRNSHIPLSAHVGWALGDLRAARVSVDEEMIRRLIAFLSGSLRQDEWDWGERDGWTSKVLISHALVRLGKPEPAYFDGLFEKRAGRAAWARLVLASTMQEISPADPRARTLLQEARNLIALGARTARLKEAPPAWGWEFWWSEPKNSAAALLAFLQADPQDPLNDKLLNGLLDHLQRDKYFSTHNAAWMLQALARYREKREGEAGSRQAQVMLGKKPFLEAAFAAGDTRPVTGTAPVADLLGRAETSPKRTLPILFTKQGTGAVQGSVLFTYVSRHADSPPQSRGITLERQIVKAAGKPVESAALGDDLYLDIAVTLAAWGRNVAVTLPLPAGVEAVDPALATTAKGAAERENQTGPDTGWDFFCSCYTGFDHVELRDDRVMLYATGLPAGTWRTRVRLRATTPGHFDIGPSYAEFMYEPEVFGTLPTGSFEVKP